MSHRSPISILGPLCCAALCLGGCGLDGILPELATDAGDPTQHVQAVIHPSKTRSLPAGVDELRIEIKDVLLRRKSDESWNILNDKPAVWSITDKVPEMPTFSAVPLAVDEYDALRVVFGRASITQNGNMQELLLVEPELTQEAVWNLDSDQGINLWLSVTGAVRQNAEGQWEAEPKLELLTSKADFSSEGLGGQNKEAKPEQKKQKPKPGAQNNRR